MSRSAYTYRVLRRNRLRTGKNGGFSKELLALWRQRPRPQTPARKRKGVFVQGFAQ